MFLIQNGCCHLPVTAQRNPRQPTLYKSQESQRSWDLRCKHMKIPRNLLSDKARYDLVFLG